MISSGSGNSIRRDILSAYLASGSRIASWVIVSALLYRESPADFALLALLRATIGLLNYTTLGLGPAMIHSLARLRPASRAVPVMPVETAPLAIRYADTSTPRKIKYVSEGLRALLASALAIAAGAMLLGLILTTVYAFLFDQIHKIPGPREVSIFGLVVMMGLATVLRLASDAPAAILQTENRITLDNVLLIGAEISWVLLTYFLLQGLDSPLAAVVAAYLWSSALIFYARFFLADRRTRLPVLFWRFVDRDTAGFLLRFGSLVAVAQLADFLYAPTDYILINALLDPLLVADYAPAVQIDAGLLLLVIGLATVLLPKSALAHAAGDRATLRLYYIRGTLASAVMLAVAAFAVWIISPMLFRLWLGNPMPRTQAILPLVLIHTVVGGCSAVGRSILLGMGKVKPFAIATLIGGITNVALSIIFVKVLNLGLRGIVYGTIAAVTLRCAIWMPWYVMRSINRGELQDIASFEIDTPIPHS